MHSLSGSCVSKAVRKHEIAFTHTGKRRNHHPKEPLPVSRSREWDICHYTLFSSHSRTIIFTFQPPTSHLLCTMICGALKISLLAHNQVHLLLSHDNNSFHFGNVVFFEFSHFTFVYTHSQFLYDIDLWHEGENIFEENL